MVTARATGAARNRSPLQSGVTLLEAMLAAGVVSMGLLGLLSVISSGLELDTTSKESHRALVAARKTIEEMRSLPVSEVWESYRAGGTLGSTFAVPELASGQGQVTFLDEAEAGALFGLSPFDCNRDGDGADAPGSTWKLYPVRVRVQWRSRLGDRRVELETVIYGHNR